MSKGHTLQDPFLNVLRKERIPVSIYLASCIKLQGHIEPFDQFVFLFEECCKSTGLYASYFHCSACTYGENSNAGTS